MIRCETVEPFERDHTTPFMEPRDEDFADYTDAIRSESQEQHSPHALHDEFKALLTAAGATLKHVEDLEVSAADTLVVVDLQNDFIPGGSFAVAEGDAVVRPICDLVVRFLQAGARVYCSRDYHPREHCSFEECGGSFPSHCVQGTIGSNFHPHLAHVINGRCHPLEGPVFIVYKGFSPDVDSFGALEYDEEVLRKSPRVAKCPSGANCGSTWTGSFLLYSSNAHVDCNAPPDVMSVLDKRTLSQHLAHNVRLTADGTPGKLFVTGLALDFCVLDTAVNAADLPNAKDLFSSVTILVDHARAAHVPHIGIHGSGFLTSPDAFVSQCRDKVELVCAPTATGAPPYTTVRSECSLPLKDSATHRNQYDYLGILPPPLFVTGSHHHPVLPHINEHDAHLDDTPQQGLDQIGADEHVFD